MFKMLDGIFCGVIYDEDTKNYYAFRDPIGICPMYWGKGYDGSIWFASEMKALQDTCIELHIFPPVCMSFKYSFLFFIKYLGISIFK